MALDFPTPTTVGQIFTQGSLTYVWDGTKWVGQAPGATVQSKIEKGNTSAEVVDTGSDGQFKVITEGTQRVTVDSTGKLGIGTISPTSLLNVNGIDTTAKIHLHSTNSGISTFDPEKASISLTATAMNTSNKYTPSINFGSTDPQFTTTNPKFGASINAMASETYSSDTKGGMDLNFWTSPSNPGTDHGLVQRMTIKQSGRVGIGTGTPFNMLDVTGTAQVGAPGADNEILKFNTDRAWSFYQVGTGASTSLDLRSSDNKNFSISSKKSGDSTHSNLSLIHI